MAEIPSSAASNSTIQSNDGAFFVKPASDDIGWKYGFPYDPTNKDKVECRLCGKRFSGGVHRVKNHIANIKGHVAGCRKSSPEDKALCKAAIEEAKEKKKKKEQHLEEVREEVNINGEGVQEDIGVEGSRKRPRILGLMDRFTSVINPESSMEATKKTRQQNIHDAISKERSHGVHQYLCRWMFEHAISFNSVDNDSFKKFAETVGQFGPGYQPPSQYQMREPLLKEEYEHTKSLLKKQEDEWKKNGCSIMTDAWTDRKRRSIMNLCVNCKEGTTFLSSKEASADAHTGEYIFEYVDRCIKDVGQENVVQIVTDNAPNNMSARNLLLAKRPNKFWSSCGTHTMNLMVEGIGTQPKFKGVIEKAKAVTIYIYSHHITLSLMRKFTRKKDIVRPGVTRFATAFLTLQSLMEKKDKLRAMVTSGEWEACKWSKSAKGKMAYSTILSLSFWNGVALCLRVFAPLVKVLRLVDGDRKPAMGFLYGELKQAKEEIKMAFSHVETNYRPILDIIDRKGEGRVDSPLHLAAYFLNPFYYYKDKSIADDPLVMNAIFTCCEKFFPDEFTLQHEVVNVELLQYKKGEGAFGRPLAVMGCAKNDDNYDPVGWWSNYGNHTPNLQRMASRILSLTASSSGCERNWSTFEGIHTKKRNRLDTKRLEHLVFVQFNARILNNKNKKKDRSMEVLLADDATHAQGWIIEGGDEENETGSGVVGEAFEEDVTLEPRRSARIAEVRELYEEDFESGDDTEDEGANEEDDLESDGDQIMDGSGEDDLI